MGLLQAAKRHFCFDLPQDHDLAEKIAGCVCSEA